MLGNKNKNYSRCKFWRKLTFFFWGNNGYKRRLLCKGMRPDIVQVLEHVSYPTCVSMFSSASCVSTATWFSSTNRVRSFCWLEIRRTFRLGGNSWGFGVRPGGIGG